MKKKTVIHILFTCLFFSCISEFDANILNNSEEPLIVVDGDIVSNSTIYITLSSTYNLSEDRPEGYNQISAEVYVIGSDDSRSDEGSYMGNGMYELNVENLNEDVKYAIEIKYDGDIYRSELLQPLATPDMQLYWEQPQEYGDVSIGVKALNDQSDNNIYLLWKYTENWEFTAPFPADIFFNVETEEFVTDESRPIYYCWGNAASKDVIISTTEQLNSIVMPLQSYTALNQRLSELYRIRVRQYRISKAAYEYYLTKKKLDQDMGGLFSPQPSELTGNIFCTTNSSKKAIGYVNVFKNITEREMYISKDEISMPYITPSCELLTQNDMFALFNDTIYADYVMFGYMPVFNNGIGKPMNWAERRCVDCRLQGSKTRPDSWPTHNY